MTEMKAYLDETVAALAEKVIEDNEVTSKLILENITSAVLMDLNNINKRGADVTSIQSEIEQRILVHTITAEVLTGIKQQSQLLFEQNKC